MHTLKGIIDKLEHRKKTDVDSRPVLHESVRHLDERDIYRYRRQRGVNLG